jgi:hypothetical protein
MLAELKAEIDKLEQEKENLELPVAEIQIEE